MSRDLAPFRGGWAEHADRHCIWIVSPPGYQHSRTFDDIAAALSHAFLELGGSAPVVTDPDAFDGRIPIILGANLLHGAPVPAGSIVYNFEQVSPESQWFTDHYKALLLTHPVLDYSRRNRLALIGLGVEHTELLPLGDSDLLRDLTPAPVQDIDVLFYGSLNERRQTVLQLLISEGVNVRHLFGFYGSERRQIIERSKMVLNLHYYDSAIFESARVVYLMANGVPVVTEATPGDIDLALLRPGLAAVPYPLLAPTCLKLLDDPSALGALGSYGRKVLARYPQRGHLERLFLREHSYVVRA